MTRFLCFECDQEALPSEIFRETHLDPKNRTNTAGQTAEEEPTMNDKTMREAFERHIQESWAVDFDLERDENGNYCNHTAQVAWTAVEWQSQQAQGEAKHCEHCNQWVAFKCLDPSGNLEVGFCEAAPAAVPEGWKLVPVEPTGGMGEAAFNVEIESNHANGEPASFIEVWQAMIAAAPSEPDSEE